MAELAHFTFNAVCILWFRAVVLTCGQRVEQARFFQIQLPRVVRLEPAYHVVDGEWFGDGRGHGDHTQQPDHVFALVGVSDNQKQIWKTAGLFFFYLFLDGF